MATDRRSRKVREFAPNFMIIRQIRNASDPSIANLVKIAGLIPKIDFRYSDLSSIDWRGDTIDELDLTGAITTPADQGGPMRAAQPLASLTQDMINQDIEFYQRAILLFAHVKNPLWSKVSMFMPSQRELLNNMGFSASVIWHWRHGLKISVVSLERLQAGALKFVTRDAAVGNIDGAISQTIEQYFALVHGNQHPIGHLSDFLEYPPRVAAEVMSTIRARPRYVFG